MDEAERVDAQVQQGAAGQFGAHQALDVQQGLEVLGPHVPQLAQRPGGDQRPGENLPGQEARPHRLHGEQPQCPRPLQDPAGLGGIEGEGLLHEDGFARLEGEHRLLGVEGVRGRDVDGLDGLIGDQILVGAVGADGIALAHTGTGVDEGPRPGGVAATDGHDRAGGEGGHVGGEPAGDVPGAEDPPAQRRGVLRLGDDDGRVGGDAGGGQDLDEFGGERGQELGGAGAGWCVVACHEPKGMRAAGRLGWKARVAELVDAPDLGSGAFGREGSSPFSRTTAVIRALVERPVVDEAGRDGCAGRSVVASDPDHGAPGGSFGSAPRTRSAVSA